MSNELANVTQGGMMSTDFTSKESVDQLVRVASAFSKTKIIPETYQGKPEDCMIAVDMANRMGVSPLMVMQNLYVVKGKPSWSGQACMTLIQSCGKFKGVRPVYTGAIGTDSRGCHIEATDIESGEAVQGTQVDMRMAKAEGWLSNSKWKNMPEQMLAYRAAAFFARVYCPERLMGVYVEGEPEDVSPERRTVPDVLSEPALPERQPAPEVAPENNGQEGGDPFAEFVNE